MMFLVATGAATGCSNLEVATRFPELLLLICWPLGAPRVKEDLMPDKRIRRQKLDARLEGKGTKLGRLSPVGPDNIENGIILPSTNLIPKF